MKPMKKVSDVIKDRPKVDEIVKVGDMTDRDLAFLQVVDQDGQDGPYLMVVFQEPDNPKKYGMFCSQTVLMRKLIKMREEAPEGFIGKIVRKPSKDSAKQDYYDLV